MTFGMASKVQGARSKDGLMDTGYEVHVARSMHAMQDRRQDSIEDALNEQ